MTVERSIILRSKSKSALENKNKRKSLKKSSTSTVLKETNSNLSIFDEKLTTSHDPVCPALKESFVPKRTLSKCKAKLDLKCVGQPPPPPVERVLSSSKTTVKLTDVPHPPPTTQPQPPPPTRPAPTPAQSPSPPLETCNKSLSKSRTSARLSSIHVGKEPQPSKCLSKYRTSVKLENSRLLSKSKTSAKLPVQISKAVCDTSSTSTNSRDKIVKKTEECNQKISEETSTTAVPEKSLKKQRTVAKFKTDPAPKSFRKTRSQSLIPEEILLSKFVNIDISDEPKEEKKNDVVRPDEIVKVKETLPTNPVETPKAISKEVSNRLKRLTFSDVDFFYFNRTAGHSSVPRDGFNTIGMDMTHSHHQNLKFNLAQEPFVRKKLFHVEEMKESEGKVSDSNTEAAVTGSSNMFQRNSSQQDQTPLHRSSPRRNAFKSVSSLFSKSDSLRRNALESCQSKQLSKFVSQVRVISEETPPSSLSSSRSAVNVSLTDTEGSDLSEDSGQLTPSQRGVEPSPRVGGVCGTRGLTPLTTKARCSLLKSHGIFNIDRDEAEDIKTIRESRETCGCSCKGLCNPLTCECILNEIECQVEKNGFPCSCGVGCGNPNGRKVFDETEVSLHYINTMMSVRGSFVI